jgi:hypothetical protein
MPQLLPHVLLNCPSVPVNGADVDGVLPVALAPSPKALRLLLGHGADASQVDMAGVVGSWRRGEAKKGRAMLQSGAFQAYVLDKLRYIQG